MKHYILCTEEIIKNIARNAFLAGAQYKKEQMIRNGIVIKYEYKVKTKD